MNEVNLTGNWTSTPWYLTLFGFSAKRRKIYHSSNYELYVWEYQ